MFDVTRNETGSLLTLCLIFVRLAMEVQATGSCAMLGLATSYGGGAASCINVRIRKQH